MLIIHLITVLSDMLLAMVSNNNKKIETLINISAGRKTPHVAKVPKIKTLIL